MKLIYIANDTIHVEAAVNAGVSRVMVDLELIGKEARQKHLDTVISRHSLDDVLRVRGLAKDTELMVRVNPIHPGSPSEIADVVNSGADVVMLPMFKTVAEVEYFVHFLARKAKCCLLLETAESLGRLEQILRISGIDEVHVGLNDLHLSLGLNFMFEILSGGLLEFIADKCRSKGITFGFGGIARIGHGLVPSEMIIKEHVRLHSKQVILSRDFRKLVTNEQKQKSMQDFSEAVDAVKRCYSEAQSLQKSDLEINKDAVIKIINGILKEKMGKQ